MRWKQFFTPVQSLNNIETQKMLQESSEDIEILDVRQPSEYQQGHIAGAKLIPLPILGDYLDQLDKDKKTVVYWAIGGRSRVAAQQLAGAGFNNVINLSGGIKAWNGHEAYGREDQGMQLFEDLTSPKQVLLTAYSLEEGLKDFYLKMMQQVTSDNVIDLFRKLAHVEDIHKARIFDEYSRMTGSIDKKAFEDELKQENLEGGMTTEEYLDRFKPDMEKVEEVIGLAMSIEAQALDLYTRAARATTDSNNQGLLNRIAAEEKIHLEQLGILLDQTMEQTNV